MLRTLSEDKNKYFIAIMSGYFSGSVGSYLVYQASHPSVGVLLTAFTSAVGAKIFADGILSGAKNELLIKHFKRANPYNMSSAVIAGAIGYFCAATATSNYETAKIEKKYIESLPAMSPKTTLIRQAAEIYCHDYRRKTSIIIVSENGQKFSLACGP
jgi:hypothetical protein